MAAPLGSLLVTGGAGFIGANFIRRLFERFPECRVVNFDALTYAGNLENLAGFEEDPRYTFVRGDICDGEALARTLRGHGVETVIHFAAESHVDRSILSGAEFVRTNVLGTQTLLQAAMDAGVSRLVHVSTDEVYGSLGAEGKFTETSPMAPNSPYAASKAASDLFVRSYFKTFGLPVLVTRCSNNYGPYQFPEKLIPLMIIRALGDEELPVYGDGLNVRDWIHVEDHADAVLAVALKGTPGEVYNIGADNEWTNIEIVKKILACVGKPDTLIRYVKDRPGHDRRYAIDASKMRAELGWTPKRDFHGGLEETVRWYLENRQWWGRVMSGAYREYFDKNYATKMS